MKNNFRDEETNTRSLGKDQRMVEMVRDFWEHKKEKAEQA